MTSLTSQIYESYVPVYDAVPATWEDARPFIVEQLKSLANAANIREIGWYLDEELISGKQFIPSPTGLTGSNQQFRTIFRKVIDCSPLIVGVNPPIPHGITFDANFTLIHMYCSATNSTTFNALTITGNNVTMDATNINITSPGAFDRAFTVIEYIQEL